MISQTLTLARVFSAKNETEKLIHTEVTTSAVPSGSDRPSLSCNFCLQNEGRGPSFLRRRLASLIRGDATQPITSCHERFTARISRFHHRVENTLEITASPKHLAKEKQIAHFSTAKAKSTSSVSSDRLRPPQFKGWKLSVPWRQRGLWKH